MIKCKVCDVETADDGFGLCINCYSNFKNHNKKYGANLLEFIEFKRYELKYKKKCAVEEQSNEEVKK